MDEKKYDDFFLNVYENENQEQNNNTTDSIDISYNAFNIATNKHENFSQTIYVGMKIAYPSYYGNCTITSIDNLSERIFYTPENKKFNDSSWAFSTVGSYLGNGTIIIHEETKNKTTEQKQIDIDSRLKHEAKSRCKDGHYTRSRGEKIIDDWLFDNRIFHVYEKLIYDKEKDQEMKPDFYLPDYNIFIEFWGLTEEWYIEKKEIKENYYKNNNITYISIEADEIDNIEDILIKRLSKYIKK